MLALFFALSYPAPVLDGSTETGPEIVFWNVGQGDFISLIDRQGCWIFDVGGSISIPLQDLLTLRGRCPGERAKLFVSHFDKDHIRNYGRLMSYLRVSDAYFSHLTPRSVFGREMLRKLQFENIRIHQIRAGYSLRQDREQLRCVWPPPDKPLRRAENDRSLVFLLRTRRTSFLLTGDLPSTMEKRLPPLRADVLKVGHHGSRHSSSSRFLNSLNPKICVVSVGAHNSFGHPNPEAMERMEEAHCAIMRTDRLGNIVFKL